MMGAAESIFDLRSLLSIVAEDTGALKMSDADEDSVGWTEEGPLPMTFGHVRRAHAALAALEAALSAAEPASSRNDEAGYVEFLNEDVPYVVRDIQGAVAILTDLETRNVIGYRVYDPHSVFAPPAPSVAVKELEWSPRNDQPQYEVCADTPFGRYKTSNKGEYGFGWMQPRQTVWSGFLPTLEEAKAAAQADYEARIRAALSAQVQDVAAKSLADAYQKYLDASDLYNERLAISKTKALGTMRVDEEYRAIDEARRAFDKLAVDIAKSALPAAPAKQEGKP